jgi:hypothetical protein
VGGVTVVGRAPVPGGAPARGASGAELLGAAAVRTGGFGAWAVGGDVAAGERAVARPSARDVPPEGPAVDDVCVGAAEKGAVDEGAVGSAAGRDGVTGAGTRVVPDRSLPPMDVHAVRSAARTTAHSSRGAMS